MPDESSLDFTLRGTAIRVLDEIARGPRATDGTEYTPYQAAIARKLHITRQAVQQHCKRLEAFGLIERLFRDIFVRYKATALGLTYLGRVKPSDLGVGIEGYLQEGLRVHYVMAILEDVPVTVPSDKADYAWGTVNVQITYGGARQNVSFWLTEKLHGLEYPGLVLALEKVFDTIGGRIGWRPSMVGWEVKNWHFNRDIAGLRIEGAKAVTLEAYAGYFERLYEKGETLRHEMVGTRTLTMDEVLAFAKDGGFNLLQAGFAAAQETRLLKTEIRQMNKTVGLMWRAFVATLPQEQRDDFNRLMREAGG